MKLVRRRDRILVMHKLTIITLLASGLLLLQTLTAEPALHYLPTETLTALRSGEALVSVSSGKTLSLQLGLAHPAGARLLTALEDRSANVAVESMFFWPEPTALKPAQRQLYVYNILRSAGSMQGIEYYSASRRRMRLFYEESTLVSDETASQALADSWQTAVPQRETLYMQQKDLTFGRNTYKLELTTLTDGLLYQVENLTTMSYAFIPLVKAHAMSVQALIVLTDDGIIFYVVSGADTLLLPGVRDKMEASFSNRASAIFNWFTAQAEKLWKN